MIFATGWKKIRALYKDRIGATLINLFLIVWVATAGLFFGKNIAHTDLTALHYNIYSGIDLLGRWQWLYAIPLLALILGIIDVILASILHTKKIVWSYWLLAAALTSNLIIFIYIFNILNFNRHA